MDKIARKVIESKKSSNVMEKSWLGPIKDSIEFLRIYFNVLHRDNKVKKLGLLNIKFVLINISLYSNFL